MFTHFPRMTKTTPARCKKRPLKSADGISPHTTIGDLITVDHTILNLDHESRNDHRSALIVQDGYGQLSNRTVIAFAIRWAPPRNQETARFSQKKLRHSGCFPRAPKGPLCNWPDDSCPYLYRLESYPTKSKDAQEAASCLRRFPSHF